MILEEGASRELEVAPVRDPGGTRLEDVAGASDRRRQMAYGATRIVEDRAEAIGVVFHLREGFLAVPEELQLGHREPLERPAEASAGVAAGGGGARARDECGNDYEWGEKAEWSWGLHGVPLPARRRFAQQGRGGRAFDIAASRQLDSQRGCERTRSARGLTGTCVPARRSLVLSRVPSCARAHVLAKIAPAGNRRLEWIFSNSREP